MLLNGQPNIRQSQSEKVRNLPHTFSAANLYRVREI